MSIFLDNQENKNTIWKVTTEGDVEGKSITTIGYFAGTVVDIATKLRGLETYALHFTPFALAQWPILSNSQANKENVVIRVHGYQKEELEKQARENGIKTQPCSIYGAIMIELPKDAILNDKKARALSKLTDEEKKILGLA